MTLWVGVLYQVSYHPIKFGGHSHSGSGVMILISHVILQGSMIKGTCDFMDRSHSWQVTTKFGMACHAHTQFIFYQSIDYYAQTNYSLQSIIKII